MMPWDKESADERRDRENAFWMGVRERRAAQAKGHEAIDTGFLMNTTRQHWWAGYQAGAQ